MAPPERLTIGDLLRLVEQLSPAEHQEFVEEMKLLWLPKNFKRARATWRMDDHYVLTSY